MQESLSKWQPKLNFPESNYPRRRVLSSKYRSCGRLLDVALISWRKEHGDVGRRVIKDTVGALAYLVDGGYVLTAKRYIYGNQVSFSLRVINAILRESVNPEPKRRWKLVLFISERGRFYDFDAEKILKDSIRNIYNGQVMLNCSIELGTPHTCSACNSPPTEL